jgi:hypothetical protein
MRSTAALGKEGRENASMSIDPDNDDFGYVYLLTIHVLHAMMDLPFFNNNVVSIK